MKTAPRIGLHVSAAGGLDNAPENAQAAGCEVFQFFSRSPRGGGAKPIFDSMADSFREKSRLHGFESYIHAPYYINFASKNHRISWGSVNAIQEELRRGSQLGVKYVVTHLGSRKDLGNSDAVKQLIERIHAIYEKKEQWTTQLLLENSAGGSDVIGDTFEELAEVIKGVSRSDVGVCLDTCHLFASGYDIREASVITTTMNAFKKSMPLSLFKLVHANDSLFGFGERRDRHTNIGDGQLGIETFKQLLLHPAFQGRNFVLETPGTDTRRAQDVVLLKKVRDEVHTET